MKAPCLMLGYYKEPEDQTRLYVLVETGSMGEQLWFFDTGYSHTTCDAAALAADGITCAPAGSSDIRAG